ncbi:hypothetical protein Hdeb2414_s0078g00778701 [Helianthus debilis subsp. tardiflorus]
MKVKSGSESVPGTPKVVPNWYLRSFGSGNSVLVASTICLSLTTGFIRTTSLPRNFFLLSFFWLSFSVFFYIFFLFLSAVSCAIRS